MEYEFALSNQGRGRLKRELGPIYAKIVEDQLKEAGFGRGFTTIKLTEKEIAVPDGLVEAFEDGIKQHAKQRLEKYLKENVIANITLHIQGNRGVMKCLSGSGKVLASYDATSGKVVPGQVYPRELAKQTISGCEITASSEAVKIKIPDNMNYTIEDLGPIPPGIYVIRPLETAKTSHVGRKFVVKIPAESIAQIKMKPPRIISVHVEFGKPKVWLGIILGYRNHLKAILGDWGTHLIPLHPGSETKLYGRSGFYIHGGEAPGSAGCIDLGCAMGDFADKLMLGDLNRNVKVTVTNSWSNQ